MKQVYVIYNLFRSRSKTLLRIGEIYKHPSDPQIFNRLVEELEKLEKNNSEEWIGNYQFVTQELFESFLENEHDIEISN